MLERLFPQQADDRMFVEDLFSVHLYTGNGSTQTIDNGIELGSGLSSGGYITLNGTNYLKSPSSSAFAFGTGNFTMEAWIYPTSVSGITGAVSTRVDGGGGSNQAFFGISAGVVLYYAGVSISGGTVTVDNWYHIACSRSGSTVRIFLNGVQVATGTDSADKTTTFGFVGSGAGDMAGQQFIGRISNARIVKGTALYTSNFTPSTTPLTAVSGTSLLTCQAPNLTADNSTNAFTLTQVGTIPTSTLGGPFPDATKGKGGLVWVKTRSTAFDHYLFDTNRGANIRLMTNATNGQISATSTLSSFNGNGFSLNGGASGTNQSGVTYASWTFREAPKFFDVVTYTGNGAGDRNIPHNLGIQPGAIIVKSVSQSGDWVFNHRMLGPAPYVGYGTSFLNSAEASTVFLGEGNLGYNGYALCASSSSTTFNIGAGGAGVSNVNASGVTYVAYLFAHDPSADGIIQCGSFANGGSGGATVTLGWEPQWVLFKASDTNDNWRIVDNMRGFANAGASSDARLFPNLSSQEFFSDTANPTATGFVAQGDLQASQTYIYVAIRRGPMKTPTLGTSVFMPSLGSSSGQLTVTTNFPSDLAWFHSRGSSQTYDYDRLRGNQVLFITTTDAESTGNAVWDSNTTFRTGDTGNFSNWAFWNFRRAPGFFDEVCYTGNGASNQAINHSLGVIPELVIVKRRSASEDWYAGRMSGSIPVAEMRLNTSAASVGNVFVYPVSQTQITVNYSFPVNGLALNASGSTYVAYLFASVSGVSKVGTYTGNGSSQTINCAFTTGARFVMIKRTDSTGDWYVWDSARGIVSGNDPYLALNSTATEVTSNDSVDPDSTGFIVNQVAASNINVNGATYIFLSIA